ncbi:MULTISPECIES: hypothetical protein [Cytobacillus]|uniref:Uncharacterized protein n=1 Tax=Cytobacillus oceanisediminis 2691 TaxID=1196031 RepID=A0A160MFA8_9BACI|nr:MULTISPECIES: hypothetical protein [Cytobacillus]AND41899.1 hypothetical protein A361_22940 [Cytobacillus oceanisediminis 2691]MCM3392849.1 hypothetical protein [Cytobacillus oceanisediminis]UQX54103.1 hypothetical protein M5V91_26405 [Cytobacillus pseudoceanisediminis]
MSNKEEEFLLNEASKDEIRIPIFEAPDGKIMATGDMFRGPYTGISSEIDLNNPGNKLSKAEERFD